MQKRFLRTTEDNLKDNYRLFPKLFFRTTRDNMYSRSCNYRLYARNKPPHNASISTRKQEGKDVSLILGVSLTASTTIKLSSHWACHVFCWFVRWLRIKTIVSLEKQTIKVKALGNMWCVVQQCKCLNELRPGWKHVQGSKHVQPDAMARIYMFLPDQKNAGMNMAYSIILIEHSYNTGQWTQSNIA